MPARRKARLWAILAGALALAVGWPGTTPGYVYDSGSGDLVLGDDALCSPRPETPPIVAAPCVAAAPRIEAGHAVVVEPRAAPARLQTLHVAGPLGARAPPPLLVERS